MFLVPSAEGWKLGCFAERAALPNVPNVHVDSPQVNETQFCHFGEVLAYKCTSYDPGFTNHDLDVFCAAEWWKLSSLCLWGYLHLCTCLLCRMCENAGLPPDDELGEHLTIS